MKQYKNIAAQKIVIAGSSGGLIEIVPGQIIELDEHIARRGRPYLQLVEDQPQLLSEAPLAPLSEEKPLTETSVGTEAKTEKSKTKKKGKKNG